MKFFRVAKAGVTIDGRTITEQHIQEMAASYDPQTYGARIKIEHFLSMHPDGPFPAQGDVIAAKVEQDGDDTYLLCALDVSEQAKAMVKDKKKVYTSIEMHPNFQNTGKAYLIGLAFTDEPASTGTEYLKFSIANGQTQNFGDAFKIGSGIEGAMFSAFMESGNFVEDTPTEPATPSVSNNWLDKFKSILSQTNTAGDQRFATLENGMVEMAETFAKERLENADTLTTLTKQVETLSGELQTLVEKLSKSPVQDYTPRPTADGTGNHQKSDF